MGVHGLWRLIEPSGKPVPLESLENKVLAVDISIWLHQAVKGFQDAKGQPLPNAHLLGIYHRVCKLLFFRVRPVFVFDGGVPTLKKETIAKRNQQKAKNISESGRIQRQLLSTLLKHYAVSKVLSETTKANIEASVNSSNVPPKDDLFALPPAQLDSTMSSSGEESDSITESTETTTDSSPTKHWDIHSIDMDSSYFKSLPPDVRHEILTEMKETRKQSSWGRLHELPTQSNDFAVFQMNRLRKRHLVQVSLEHAEQEMGGHSLSLAELESLLNDQGVLTDTSIGNRIASDENTRFLLIKDIKKAMEKARQNQVAIETIKESAEEIETVEIESNNEKTTDKQKQKNAADLEYEDDLQKAIQLSLEGQETVPENEDIPEKKTADMSYMNNFNDADFESDSSAIDAPDDNTNVLVSAKNYMMEYSGLTPSEIAKIIGENTSKKKKDSVASTSNALEKRDNVQPSTTNIVQERTDDQNVLLEYSEITTKSMEEPYKNIDKEGHINSSISDSVKTATDIEESDSSEEFVDVPETKHEQCQKEKTKSLEIFVNPTKDLDDDIFSDIFNDTVEENKSHTAATDDSTKEITSEISTELINEDSVSNLKEKLDLDDLKLQDADDGHREIIASPKTPEKLSTEQLKNLKESLSKEQEQLVTEQSTKERLASNITDQMYQEAQELLELFGVPYVIAPMEAEAQCAFLDEINLTDGTITDDSDIWLFGGKTVYKNFFNQSKHVMEFQSDNIQHSFNLTREQMILLALLVGSDYTTGIQGIGPVTALEVLAAFPYSKSTEIRVSNEQLLSGLAEFRKWLNGGKTPGPGRTLLKNKLKNVVLSESFPSLQVVQAYLEPTVETSREAFSWAKPDVVGLIDFAKEKFGWSKTKSEEILNPVLKRLNETRIQTSIKDYFKTSFKRVAELEKPMSKRVKQAIDKIGKESRDSPDEQERALVSKGKTKKQRQPKKTANVKSKQKTKKQKVDDSDSDEDIQVLKQTKVKSKKKLEDMKEEIKNEIEEAARKARIAPNPHKREVILQKEKDKTQLLKAKLKAIEVFRKSKQGPGYVKKKSKIVRQPKEDAELSESSSE